MVDGLFGFDQLILDLFEFITNLFFYGFSFVCYEVNHLSFAFLAGQLV